MTDHTPKLERDEGAILAKIREGADMIVDGLNELAYRRGDRIYGKLADAWLAQTIALKGMLVASGRQRAELAGKLILPKNLN